MMYMNNPLQYGGMWDDDYFSNYYSKLGTSSTSLSCNFSFAETFVALAVQRILIVSGASASVTLAS